MIHVQTIYKNDLYKVNKWKKYILNLVQLFVCKHKWCNAITNSLPVCDLKTKRQVHFYFLWFYDASVELATKILTQCYRLPFIIKRTNILTRPWMTQKHTDLNFKNEPHFITVTLNNLFYIYVMLQRFVKGIITSA